MRGLFPLPENRDTDNRYYICLPKYSKQNTPLMKTFIPAIMALLLLSVALTSTYGQKKTVCYDLEGKEVTEKQLKALEIDNLIIGERELDGVMEKKLMQRDISGQLAPEVYTQIRNRIAEIPGSNLDKKPIIVIGYYPGEDPCNSTGLATREDIGLNHIAYLKQLNRLKVAGHYNIYKNNSGLKRYSVSRKWYEDKDGLIERTFFPYHYPCGSYVVIAPDGKYRGYLAEFHSDQILEGVEAIKKEQ
jgi:hypothetical protein